MQTQEGIASAAIIAESRDELPSLDGPANGVMGEGTSFLHQTNKNIIFKLFYMIYVNITQLERKGELHLFPEGM